MRTDNRLAAARFGKFGRSVVQGAAAELVAFPKPHDAIVGFCQPRPVGQHGLEYGLKLARGAADDAQHLRSRSLLLQRFAQLIEQPGVLDGNDGLSRKVFHQLNLLVGEWADLLAVYDDSADQLIVLEHRHSDRGSRTAELDRRSLDCLCRVVGGVGHLLRLQDATDKRARIRQKWPKLLLEFDQRRRRTVVGRKVECLAVEMEQRAELSPANPRCVLQHGLENGLQLAG